MAKKAKVIKEKSIEDRIWDSANKLRGNLTASEYQNVVLGLVFLKYRCHRDVIGTDTVLKTKLFGLKVRHFNNPCLLIAFTRSIHALFSM